METLYSTSAFTSEASLSAQPHTPPYTPARIAKRRLERSDSPASTVGSIHPADTDSPAKKAPRRSADLPLDDIKVEELVEGDLGYMTDMDVVYPEELEEISSGDSELEELGLNDVSDSEATRITRRLSRLRCGDDSEFQFEQERRKGHIYKRRFSRMFKRTHSQSAKSDTELADIDALDDHDHNPPTRRLRRRVEGPYEADDAFGLRLRRSPDVSSVSTAPGSAAEEDLVLPIEIDAMDVDDGK